MGHSCLDMVERQPSRRNSYKPSERAKCPGEELRDSAAAVVTRPGPQMWTGPGRGSHEAGCVWGGDFVLGSLRPVMKTREVGGRHRLPRPQTEVIGQWPSSPGQGSWVTRNAGEGRVGSVRSQGYLDSVGDVLEASVRDLEKRKGQGVPGVGRRLVGSSHGVGAVSRGVRGSSPSDPRQWGAPLRNVRTEEEPVGSLTLGSELEMWRAEPQGR